MIAYIDGKLTFKDPTYVIIETNGVGYQIKISLNTYSALKEGERCKLLTYLQVKEDAHVLFGFSEPTEKKVFMDLISISGVGPSTALMCLSSLSAGEIQQAIVNEDLKTIQGIKGIGSKTAQRIILELKDKVKKDTLLSDYKISPDFNNTTKNEALSALITLGIAKNVAEKNIDSILKKEGTGISLEHLIKLALKTA